MGTAESDTEHPKNGRGALEPESTMEPRFIVPGHRRGTVERLRLVKNLRRDVESGVVTIVAPAGYGKSTLMAQWARYDKRPTTWLTVDASDNDPAVLVRHLFEAAQLSGMVAHGAVGSIRIDSEGAPTRGVEVLARSFGEAQSPGLLMLDHVESLRSRGARDVLAELSIRLPAWIVLVVSARSAPPVPTSHLRTRGSVHELGPADLVMSEDEAREMFLTEGIDPGPALEPIVARAEGWPVALYLIVLAVNAGVPLDTVVDEGRNDRFITDYLRQELLHRLPRERSDFLMRTSILERLSGPICDFVLEREGSSLILEQLERANLLIVPLDRTRTWYRYHGILRDHLRMELERTNATEVANLHHRAAHWLADHEQIGRAVHHAQRANDREFASRLIAAGARTAYSSGEIDTALGWLEWLESSSEAGPDPELAALGFLGRALTGDVVRAEQWAERIDRATDDDPASVQLPLVRLVRVMRAEGGVESMVEDATAAAERLDPWSEWYPAAMMNLGVAHVLAGDVEAADAALERAIGTAGNTLAPPSASFSLAVRATIAIDQDRVGDARAYASEAVSIVRSFNLAGSSSSCLPFVVAARCSARQGDVADARALLVDASRIRPLLTAALPGISVYTLLEMSRAFVEVADIAGARQVLRDAKDILARRPRLGVLTARHLELQDTIARLPAGTVGPSSLTTAELRLLPFLVTHLTFPEIGERLYVSRHTVKTQAMSIYRKLGVSSRSEAVERCRELGLLGS